MEPRPRRPFLQPPCPHTTTIDGNALGHPATRHSTPPTATRTTTERPAALTATAVTTGLEPHEPIGKIISYTAATDPNHLLGHPRGYTSKAAFTDTRADGPLLSAGIAAIGSVEVYPTRTAALARARYIQKITASLPPLAEYDYVSGGTLLRLYATLTPAQAAGYKQALAMITSLPVTTVR